MLFGKKLFKTLLIFITVLICSFTVSPLSANADTESLYLGGFPAGFTLSTTTVEVVGICDVITSEGLRSPAKECGMRTGDIIDKINGVEVNSTGDINKILCEQYKRFIISVIRNGENLEFEINPVSDRSSGSKKLGILVKDSINGIGTVTYIDGKNKKFASLGHPVSNAVNKMIEIMKAIKNLVMLSTFAGAMCFSSCSNDEDVNEVNNGEVRFTAGIGHQAVATPAASRAADTAWDAGDKIGIFMVKHGETTIAESASNKKFTTATGDGNFTPVTGYEIYYPMDASPVDFISGPKPISAPRIFSKENTGIFTAT